MDRQVIYVYGASGSGTSTIGRFVSEKLGYYFMDADDYFWEPTNPPYTTKRNASDRSALMRNDIEKYEKVVISGSVAGWGDELTPLFTLAIRVETDTAIRIERLKNRERLRFGSRIDPGGDMYEHHQEFIAWAAAYDNGGLNMRSRSKHDEWQKRLQCPQILLDGSLPVEENYEVIRRSL